MKRQYLAFDIAFILAILELALVLWAAKASAERRRFPPHCWHSERTVPCKGDRRQRETAPEHEPGTPYTHN